jgi:putative transposase
LVGWSKELLDFNSVPSQTLQEVCSRVDKAFERYVAGNCHGKRSGKPRIKTTTRFRSLVFEGVYLHHCSIKGKWLFITIPKIGIVKLRHHRSLPDGAKLKSAQLIKKADGWYINLRLEDISVPSFEPNITPNWDNSLGMDAVLHENDYLATSEGIKLPSLKSFRKSQSKLAKVSQRKSLKKKGSKFRRKLAKREAKIHQQIARARKDHAYSTAHKLMATGKKVFFHEKLNIAGLSRRNKPKQDEKGVYLPNGNSRKSGLNKSWLDAAFHQFFKILKYIGEKTGALVVEVNSQYTSMILPYKDEFVFTDLKIRNYWDEELNLLVDRDIASSINVKRVGLDLFPTIKRRKGNPVVVASTTNSTSKEVLSVLRNMEKPALYA